MNPWLVLYWSQQGQAWRIANHMAHRLDTRFCDVRVRSITSIHETDLAEASGVIFGTSVHENRFPRVVKAFVKRHARTLSTLPSGLYSVSLSAASPDPDRRYEVQKMTAQLARDAGWHPKVCAAFAGQIPSPEEYGFFKRMLLRRTLRRVLGKGKDFATDDLTDWREVSRFVDCLVPPVA